MELVLPNMRPEIISLMQDAMENARREREVRYGEVVRSLSVSQKDNGAEIDGYRLLESVDQRSLP